MRLYLVRHAAVAVDPARPGPEWHLSADGRAAADALATQHPWADVGVAYSSNEPKAIATAQRIVAPHGLPLRIDRELREVEGRRWVEGGAARYEEFVRGYLAGDEPDGWEELGTVRERVTAAVDAALARHAGDDVAVVSHGLALTAYVSGLLGLNAAAAFEMWSAIRFPDVAIVDPATQTLERPFGG